MKNKPAGKRIPRKEKLSPRCLHRQNGCDFQGLQARRGTGRSALAVNGTAVSDRRPKNSGLSRNGPHYDAGVDVLLCDRAVVQGVARKFGFCG